MLKIIFSQALAILAQCGHWSSDCDYWCFRNGKSSLRSSVELRERNFQVSEEPLKQQAGSERGKTSFITYCAAITKKLKLELPSSVFPSAFSPVDQWSPGASSGGLQRHEVVTLLRETQLWQLYGLWGHGRTSS